MPPPRERFLIAVAALMALFLAALDTLVMSAAMPTVVADLGTLQLYSWVFTSYMLSRAVAMPIFGKLADIFNCKNLFIISIAIFMIGSLLAGISQSMVQLVTTRTVQGIGAGGSFALIYVVLSEITAPENRSKMMSWGSVVWGVASVLGPPLGGFIVAYFSWRWVFFINIPLGIVSLIGINRYFRETRKKTKETIIDYAGIATMTITILSALVAFMMVGRSHAWFSLPVIGLLLISFLAGTFFCMIEKRAREPLLSLSYFGIRGFWAGNAVVFWCSFAIFSFSAFSPLFIQGALGKTPEHLGVAMLTLSLSWSLGAWICGRMAARVRKRQVAILGAVLMAGGSSLALTFTVFTSLITFSMALCLAGLGMGFVSLATLLIVQDSLHISDLGVATSTNQFVRSVGGTIGVGISGALVTVRFSDFIKKELVADRYEGIDPELISHLRHNVEILFQPEFQSHIPAQILRPLQIAVCDGVTTVFWGCLLASLTCLLLTLILPAETIEQGKI